MWNLILISLIFRGNPSLPFLIIIDGIFPFGKISSRKVSLPHLVLHLKTSLKMEGDFDGYQPRNE